VDITKLLVVIGSTRPIRIGDQIATLVAEAASAIPSVDVTLDDLAVRDLPLLDEPQPAAMGALTHLHSKDWAATVEEADGVVFVTPEYNAGYPAALKNAIDYLHAEWEDKPALIVSYGGRGGPRVQKQLAEVAGSLKMRLTETPVLVSFGLSDFGPDGRLTDARSTVSPHADDLQKALLELVELADRHETSTAGFRSVA
jgi:NAD(P)H-dependent FMN reductase